MTGTDFVYNPPPFFQREVKARRGGMDGLGLAPPLGELAWPIPREAMTERAFAAYPLCPRLRCKFALAKSKIWTLT